MKHGFLLLFLSLLLPATAAESGDKSYRIRVIREEKVGDKAHVEYSGSGRQTRTTSLDGKVAGEKSGQIAGRLSGQREFLEVNKAKRGTKFRFTVEKMLVKIDEGEEKEGLPAGTQIIVTRTNTGDLSFSVEGKEIDGDARKLADLFFDLPNVPAPKVSLDQAFGTDEPRKPGTTWTTEIPRVLESLPATVPFEPLAEGSSTRFSFPEVKEVEGTPCCHFTAEVKLNLRSFKDLPLELTPLKGQTVLTFDYLLPEDPALPESASTGGVSLEFSAAFTGKHGERGVMSFSTTRKVEVRSRPVR